MMGGTKRVVAEEGLGPSQGEPHRILRPLEPLTELGLRRELGGSQVP